MKVYYECIIIGVYNVHHILSSPLHIGNVILQASAAVRISAFEMYVSGTGGGVLEISGIEQGGENMIFEEGTLKLVGKIMSSSP